MKIRTIAVLTLLILSFIANSQATIVRETEPRRKALSPTRQEVVLDICRVPDELSSTAEVTISNYFRGKSLNSTFYQDFIWIHPEYVNFASCVVCITGFPNDPFWESDFNLYCQEAGLTLATDTEADSETGLL